MSSARRRLADAEERARIAESLVAASWNPWREKLHEHRTAALLGGGFAAGLGLALLPVRWWARAGGLAFRAAAQLARSAWVPRLPGGRTSNKPDR